MTILLENPYILLCEGVADRAFFSNLARERGILLDIPFPPPPQYDGKFRGRLHSRDGFGAMLETLDGLFTLAPDLLKKVKGILVAFDARDNALEELKYVVNQFPAGYGRPIEPITPVAGTDGRPPISVMPVPLSADKGSLETLCIEALRSRHTEIVDALDVFLHGDPIQVRNWPSEKKDKSRLACGVAVTNNADPTKTLQYLFGGAGAVIDVTLECFRATAEGLQEFVDRVNVM